MDQRTFLSSIPSIWKRDACQVARFQARLARGAAVDPGRLSALASTSVKRLERVKRAIEAGSHLRLPCGETSHLKGLSARRRSSYLAQIEELLEVYREWAG